MSPDGAEGRRIPDFWTSADSYRDSTLLVLNHIRFGKGLRYFLDPLRVSPALLTEADGGIIPVSDSFRIQFQAWLMKKYHASVVQLREAWGIKNNDITDYPTAVRCQALWFESKGAALMYDPSTLKTYEVLPANSHYWRDIRDFETQTVQRDMNSIADALKQGVADVPVLYTWSSQSPVFTNLESDGMDGLCVSARRHGDDIVKDGAGAAFAAVEQARKTQWYILRAQASSQASDSGLVGDNGSAGRAGLTADRTASESIGAKGFYVESPQTTGWTAGDSVWLKWIKSDSATRSVDAESFVATKPRTIFYPVNIALHHPAIEQLAPRVWWLPTFEQGSETDLGRSLYGYSLKNAAGLPTFVVWTAKGGEEVSKFRFPKGANPEVRNPDGTAAAVSTSKETTTIVFGGAPKIVSGVSALPLPEGAVQAAVAEAVRLVDIADKAKIPVEEYSQRLFYIRSTLMPNNATEDPTPAYLMVNRLIGALDELTTPFTWVEGEAASQQTFESMVSSPDASGKAFLWLDTKQDAPGNAGSYYAIYQFLVNAPAEYTIWASIAPGPPGSTNTSPIVFRVDDQPPADVNQPIVGGEPYGQLPFNNAPVGGAFVWCNLGSVQLTAGAHRIQISVAGRAVGSNRYTLGIDALNITRVPFIPKGPEKPVF
jgi:hypothetical protein